MTPLDPITIGKDIVNTLPIENFTGNVHIVDTHEAALAAIKYLQQQRILGIDTETRPSFRKGHSYKVSLVQLSTHTDCFLFRINKIGFIDELRDLFTDKNILKIGLSLRDDISVLHRVDQFEPQNFIDLQNIAPQHGISDRSLQKIYAIIFGKKISKSQRLSNWEAPQLTVAQQYYAALDAWACLHIYDALQGNAPFYYTQPMSQEEMKQQ